VSAMSRDISVNDVPRHHIALSGTKHAEIAGERWRCGPSGTST
jgi:hypothetical protein